MKKPANKKVPVSIGIMAYNEERNIGKILKSLINQTENKIELYKPTKIIVDFVSLLHYST